MSRRSSVRVKGKSLSATLRALDTDCFFLPPVGVVAPLLCRGFLPLPAFGGGWFFSVAVFCSGFFLFRSPSSAWRWVSVSVFSVFRFVGVGFRSPFFSRWFFALVFCRGRSSCSCVRLSVRFFVFLSFFVAVFCGGRASEDGTKKTR